MRKPNDAPFHARRHTFNEILHPSISSTHRFQRSEIMPIFPGVTLALRAAGNPGLFYSGRSGQFPYMWKNPSGKDV
jgi:hypothetical protein